MPAGTLRQGDVFESMSFFRGEASKSESGLHAVGSSHPQVAMLLNQSCDIDKPSFSRLIVVPVVELAVLSSSDQTRVKKNRIYSRLYLPSYRDVLVESFVSFSEPMTVDKEFL